MAVFQFSNKFNRAIESQQASDLAILLKKDYHNSRETQALEQALSKKNLDDFCRSQVAEPWDELLASHFKGVLSIQRKNFADAYTHQSTLIQSFLKIFNSSDTSWYIPIIYNILLDLRILSRRADFELKQKNQKADKMEDCVRILMQSFGLTVRGEVQRRFATVGIVNHLFKLHFAMNNLRMCKNLTRTIESPGFPPLQQFPIGHQVTYRFYAGRLALFDGDFKKAEENLSFAFQRCTRKNVKNKRMSLLYLTAVRILLGKLPSDHLLKHYQLHQYQELVLAIQQGNLGLFNNTLATHQDFFIRKGIYLILERAKILVYRNLFKKIWKIQNDTKIPIASFVRAMEWMGIKTDKDEMECITANLIYSGYIKGYLSHKIGVLVVSAKDPFPQITRISVNS